MSCQRLDALFYCLFKKAGVDLTSLANMSQQQQQTNGQVNGMGAVNGASNSMVGIIGNSANWNSLIKQNHSDNEDDDSMINNNNGVTNVVVTSSNASANPTYSTLANHYQQHHTIVPAQIQVQVQIQVPIITTSSQQQQQTIDANSTANANQSRLYLLSPSAAVQNPPGLTSYAILEA